MKYAVVVAWHNREQIEKFCKAWHISAESLDWVILQQDKDKEGCARTKNKGIRRALDMGADVIVVLDDDCYCYPAEFDTLEQFVEAHVAALEPQSVPMFQTVTDPPSRGTPYYDRKVTMPVAASMGFWTGVPDLDAASQLTNSGYVKFIPQTIFGRYFPLSGMNFAFHREQWPWCQLIDVPRYDDIWMGFLWQKHAYETGQCFNLNGPGVQHSRQSNVWHNLRVEVQNMERNETMWQKIQEAPVGLDYDYLKLHVGL